MVKPVLFVVAAVLAFGGGMVAMAPTAEAVVCARGVYRAGCAGPRGAVVAPRAARGVYVAPRAPRGVYVAPRPAVRCAYVNGRRVCR